MGDGTRENPYTREDVLRLIKEHSNTAEGLDLSEKWFEADIDLRQFNLQGIILKNAVFEDADFEEAQLWRAHLEGADLGHAHLEETQLWRTHLEGADLTLAHLEGAQLWRTHLEGADLTLAHLEGAYLGHAHLERAFLWGTQFSPDTRVEDVDWGNYVLGEEKPDSFDIAADTYRRLKIWHTNAGMYDIAGKFFFREMTVRRKALEWWPKPWNRAFSKILSILCGYGEKPERVVVSALVIILGLAIAYRFGGLDLLYSIYFSFVSFTALGYGSWVPEPTGWVKGLGVFEAVIGVFSMALFLVTFTRKMTR